MDDSEMVQGLRALTELSLNLNRLELANETLQRQLYQRYQTEGPSPVVEAALLLARANANLRVQLAKDYENRRMHLIRATKSTNDVGLTTRLENAFQMDWFSSLSTGPRDLDGIAPDVLNGQSIDEKVASWGFEKSQANDIVSRRMTSLSTGCLTLTIQIEALHASLPVPIPQAEVRYTTCSKRDAVAVSQDGWSSNGTGASSASFDYGFPAGNNEPYVFDHDADSSITVVPGGANDQIKCGTLHKLIERLTDDRLQDLNLRFVFLLTYHSFTTAHDLLQALVQRYFTPAPPNATPGEIQYFQRNRQKGIRLKVFSVLKKWVEDHFCDFEQDEGLRRELCDLLQTRLAVG